MEKIEVVYKKTEGTEIGVDLHILHREAPTVFHFHGGGLIFGTRKWISERRLKLFSELGFNTACFDYRLAPATKLASIQQDVSDAVEWFAGQENRYINNRQYISFGGSAGAYLALFTGTLARKPDAVVSFYGYAEMDAAWTKERSIHHCESDDLMSDGILNYETSCSGDERLWFYNYCRCHGIWNETVTGNAKYAETITSFDEDFPPVFLAHGMDDTDVPYAESEKIFHSLISYGKYHRLRLIPGAGHLFDEKQNQITEDVYDDVREFLRQVCKY